MNFRKTIFAFGGIGIILVLAAFCPESLQAASGKKTAVPETASRETEKKVQKTAEKSAGTLQAEDHPGVGDPFNYASGGTGEYSPVSGSKNVGIITVKGIIRIDGGEPKAILHLKDSGRVHYVSKDSVVRVSTGSKNGNSPAEAYIVVKNIRNDEVELIQLERPDKVIIIR